MRPTLPLLLVSLALSACAAGAQQASVDSATATPSAVAQAPVAAPAPAPAPAPAAPAAAPVADLAAGRQAFEQGCFACHDQATIVSNGGRSRAEWQEVVAMMQDRGFSGTPTEIQLIVDYLTATYPAKPKA
jgi:mono/diheme cytochrome c family protein